MVKLAHILALCGLALAAPLSAQESVPRPSAREGPDTTCGPNYSSRPFGDTLQVAAKAPDTGRVVTLDTRPPCSNVIAPGNPAVVPAPPANAQVTPLSPKADSLRQQADSAGRRPKN